MLVKTRGIVLRQMKYRDTSLIVDLFTEELGMRSYLLSGVRTPRARNKAALYQLMSLLEVVVYEREGKSLQRVREARPAHLYERLPFEPPRTAVGMFMAEVAGKVLREAGLQADLFAFLFEAFRELDLTAHPVGNYHLSFLAHFCGWLGFQPEPELPAGHAVFFDLKEGTFQATAPAHPHHMAGPLAVAFAKLIRTPLPESHTVPLSRSQRRELLDRLLDFYHLHVEGLGTIRSHEIWAEVLHG